MDTPLIICVGGDSWSRAKRWQSHADFAALLLNSEQNPTNLDWQVGGCVCLIEWGIGPGEGLIIDLVKALLRAGALSVTVMPLFINYKTPLFYYYPDRQSGKRWAAVRESIKTYHSMRHNRVA